MACPYVAVTGELVSAEPRLPSERRMSGPTEILNISASGAIQRAREEDTLSMLIDVTTCIGCKACEVACVEWNDLHLEPEYGKRVLHSYQTMPDMTPAYWNLIRFDEIPVNRERQPLASSDGVPGVMLLMRKDMCMHCAEPGCLVACPAEGAIVQYVSGIVDFRQEHCIGCGYCMTGCPFHVPKFNPETKTVFKCTMCTDRVENGLGPACVKACPTGCLEFGTKKEMKARAEHRVGQVKEEGFPNAGVYDPPGVGGTGVVYVLHHADRPELYGGLPRDPKIDPQIRLWKGPLKIAGGLLFGMSLAAAVLHYFTAGPRRTAARTLLAPAEPVPAAAAEREIVRYTVLERLLHWTVAGTFVYLMLTGAGLFSPKLGWLLSVCGGGQFARAWHPVVGCVFTAAVVTMFALWFRDLRITPDDRVWLKRMRDYLAGRDEGLPPTGRFNAGQKLTFMSQVAHGLALLASGIPVWFPEEFSRDVRLWAILLHSVSAVAAVLTLVAHIHMAVFITRGAVRAMTEGKVTESWARHHHGKWAEEKLKTP